MAEWQILQQGSRRLNGYDFHDLELKNLVKRCKIDS